MSRNIFCLASQRRLRVLVHMPSYFPATCQKRTTYDCRRQRETLFQNILEGEGKSMPTEFDLVWSRIPFLNIFPVIKWNHKKNQTKTLTAQKQGKLMLFRTSLDFRRSFAVASGSASRGRTARVFSWCRYRVRRGNNRSSGSRSDGRLRSMKTMHKKWLTLKGNGYQRSRSRCDGCRCCTGTVGQGEQCVARY